MVRTLCPSLMLYVLYSVCTSQPAQPQQSRVMGRCLALFKKYETDRASSHTLSSEHELAFGNV